MIAIETWLAQAEQDRLHHERPLVSLCYAQSLDGSIALQRGQPTALSGPESSHLTHQLRAAHDGILVGIGTLLADDPRLTARLPGAANPQPVILDSCLRTPTGARIFQENPRQPWIACLEPPETERRAALETAGARLLALPASEQGRVHLPSLLDCLSSLGIRRLMVEGGASVITAFLAEGLANLLVVTVAPVLLGGFPAIAAPIGRLEAGGGIGPRLVNVEYHPFGEDWVVFGRLRMSEGEGR